MTRRLTRIGLTLATGVYLGAAWACRQIDALKLEP